MRGSCPSARRPKPSITIRAAIPLAKNGPTNDAGDHGGTRSVQDWMCRTFVLVLVIVLVIVHSIFPAWANHIRCGTRKLEPP